MSEQLIEKSYLSLIADPKGIAPQLSDKMIERILSHTLLSQQKGSLSLGSVITTAHILKKYGKHPLPKRLQYALEDLSSLSWVNHLISDTLNELQELSSRTPI